MVDKLDRIQEQEDLLNQLHIQAARGRGGTAGEGLTHCAACGNDIPQERREAVPGYAWPASSGLKFSQNSIRGGDEQEY
jgi:RNA polymerase-binding transcription factor DksA